MDTSLINVDSVNAILKVEVKKADYQGKVDEAIKSFRKKANVPGFRPGTVPAGMVKKMYGKSILAEEVNKLVGEGIYNYIQENKLNILGEPLPNQEKQQPIDFAKEEDFEFFFDIALAPEIKLDLSKKDKMDYFKIAIDEELVEKQISSYKANYGKYESIEEDVKETDLLKGEVVELENGAPKADGIAVENAVLMPSYMKDEEEKAKFTNIKKEAQIVFNPGKAYDGNETEIASFLHIDKDKVEAIAPEFMFTVKDITRYKEADLDQALFDKVFGEGTVKTEAEFREKIKESLASQLAPDSDYKFLLDARTLLESKVGELTFPDAFLKRWLLTTGKDKTAETLEAEYPRIIEDLKFHLIKEQLAKDNDIKIEEADVRAVALQAARVQFAQYGMVGMPDDVLMNYANEMLKNQETSRSLVDKAMEEKIAACLKSAITLNEKELSLDEFKKFFETEETEQEA
ncbi:trigger factor [Dysgonomonas macrotermitis]|uniref:Trigger factor n=1 Tax=Dysgonomonas macrotermitis TaxID=1346286 RepID=A0A1M4UEJ9_9BACT|nr:trigger factor [Dysgonomonas macrotermitis]SHE55066.1 trigger factor [Dysgonomonas macrotermitis]